MRNHFLANLDDLRFVLWDVFPTESILSEQPYRGAGRAHYDALMQQGLAFARELGESYQQADAEGCRLGDDGEVRIPSAFAALWQRWRDWQALFAQQGRDTPVQEASASAPALFKTVLMEMFMGANPAFMCYGGFTVPAAHLIEQHGTALQKDLFLRRLRSFEWDACYCATESQAGSDLLAIAAVASELGDCTWSIAGEKRYITAGMHGLTGNTVYLVLARPQSAAANSMFLSCYLVPRLWIDPETGALSDNHVDCVEVPDKMGLRGCPNTRLAFGARGVTRAWLLGDRRNAALLQFTALARLARFNSSLFATGLAANSMHASVAYARTRVQGPRIDQAVQTGGSVAIMQHADVRRMLLEMKARVEGMRGIVAHMSWISVLATLEASKPQPDPDRIELFKRVANLLVPVSKVHSANEAWRVCELGIQVHGGIGYTTAAAVEQYARDVKILSIWEGTDYVQALILMRDVFVYGRNLHSFDMLEAWIAERRETLPVPPELAPRQLALEQALAALRDVLGLVHTAMREDRLAQASAHFVTITRAFGVAMAALALLESASAALRKRAAAPTTQHDFLEGKIKAMEYYFTVELTEAQRRLNLIGIDDWSCLQIEDGHFGVATPVGVAA